MSVGGSLRKELKGFNSKSHWSVNKEKELKARVFHLHW